MSVIGWSSIRNASTNSLDVTGDHQWIHVDVRARARKPLRRTYRARVSHAVAGAGLSKDNFRLGGAKLAINYGLNKVRFLAPVPVDSRIRVRSQLAEGCRRRRPHSQSDGVAHHRNRWCVKAHATVAEMIVRAVY